ncbi:MAG: hypothetical protein NT079_02135, partial [Candidatus Omnitrophica bacterium]|nr:hypothetical protein [Candidatus Omnitrophota bacterium]
ELEQWARVQPQFSQALNLDGIGTRQFPLEKIQGESAQPNIKVTHIVNSCVSGDKRYYVGMITKDFVLKQIPDHQERIFYIFGPPKMVDAMKSICQEIGCGQERIKAENFTGY